MLYAKIEDSKVTDFVSTVEIDADDPDFEEKTEKHEAMIADMLANGFIDITDRDISIGDQTDDGGETFREREPGVWRALRACVMGLKALDQNEPIPQAVRDELKKIKDM